MLANKNEFVSQKLIDNQRKYDWNGEYDTSQNLFSYKCLRSDTRGEYDKFEFKTFCATRKLD